MTMIALLKFPPVFFRIYW